MGYAIGNNGDSIWGVNYPEDVPEGFLYIENWPTDADKEALFPGYLLRHAKIDAKQALDAAYALHSNDNFLSSADGTSRQWDGNEESEETLTRNTLDAVINSDASGWTTYYYAIDGTGSRSKVDLTAVQVKALFADCQAKHAAADANYVAKVQAIADVTDISSIGVAAVNAVVW